MADMSTTNGKPKLPPLTSKSGTETDAPPKKKVVKKKKKPAEDGETNIEVSKDDGEVKPTPRKKKAASASSTTDAGGETAAPKKKKKVVKQTSEQQEVDPASARSAASASQGEVCVLLTCLNLLKLSPFDQRYILYRDLKLLLNIDICPRYDCRSGRQVNRGKKSIFLSAAESVLKVCISAKIYC